MVGDGFDEVDVCGCVAVELFGGSSGPSVTTGSKVMGAGVVGLARSVKPFHNQVSHIAFLVMMCMN